MNKIYVENYQKHQYEDLVSDKFMQGQVFDARYIKQVEPTYKNNILIEALPPIKDMEDTYDDIVRNPLFSELEREKTEVERIHAVYRLQDYIAPTPAYFSISDKIALAIRRRYVNKKVFSPEFNRDLRITSELLKGSTNDIKQFRDVTPVSGINCSTSPGFAVMGLSGAGKTTAVTRILSCYPQVIRHYGNGEQDFLFTQLVWLKVDSSFNGKISGLCRKILFEFDRALGTDYYKKYGNSRNTVDKMIIAISHLVNKHALGVLVVDEIQHLKSAKYESATALNFFVSLMNEINLPIVYVGTYAAVDNLLGKDFRHARRASGIGIVEMSFMDKDDNWDFFMENLWHYQWLKKKTILTQEIKDAMYEKTAGIMERITSLYMLAQFEAIRSGDEEITPALINTIAKKQYFLTKDMVTALINHDISALVKYEDMLSPNIQEYFENIIEDEKHKEEMRKIVKSEDQKNKHKKSQIIDEITLYLLEIEDNQVEMAKVAKDIVEEHGAKKPIAFLKQMACVKVIELMNLNKDSKEAVSKREYNKKSEKKGSKSLELKDNLEENIKNIPN